MPAAILSTIGCEPILRRGLCVGLCLVLVLVRVPTRRVRQVGRGYIPGDCDYRLQVQVVKSSVLDERCRWLVRQGSVMPITTHSGVTPVLHLAEANSNLALVLTLALALFKFLRILPRI